MKIPSEIEELLEKLEPNEDVQVKSEKRSKATVTYGRTTFQLDAEDCQKVFANAAAAELFFETLGEPDDATLEIDGVEVSDDVFELLEEQFADVEVY